MTDDEGYEDGDWGICERCGKRLKRYEDNDYLCANCNESNDGGDDD